MTVVGYAIGLAIVYVIVRLLLELCFKAKPQPQRIPTPPFGLPEREAPFLALYIVRCVRRP